MKIRIVFISCLSFLSLVFSGCSNSDSNSSGNISTDKNCTQTVNIPDANFKAKLLSATASLNNVVASNLEGFVCKIDANDDGIIQVCEAENISELTVDNTNISSLEGLLAFRNLKSLSCKYNKIKTLDLSSLKKLQSIYCTNNALTNLNTQGLSNLKLLYCDHNQLTTIDLSAATLLETLWFDNNKISTLNISNSKNITGIRGDYNLLTSLTVSHLKNLNQLYISDNLLTSLDVKDLANLTSLHCSNNKMTALNASNCVKLMDISCDQNVLTSINLSNCGMLNALRCFNNKLTTINLNGLTGLQNLDISNNLLTSLDIRYCPILAYISVYNMSQLQTLVLKNGSTINDYYLGNNPNLNSICCDASEVAQVQSQVNFWGYNCVISTNCF
jgi:Leucine-rich repeat (LRR) protein